MALVKKEKAVDVEETEDELIAALDAAEEVEEVEEAPKKSEAPKKVVKKTADKGDVYYRTTAKCVGNIHDPDTGITFSRNLRLGPANPKQGSFLQVQIDAGLLEQG